MTSDAKSDAAVERCGWVSGHPMEVRYHDEEWGVPCRDDAALFERLLLECFQAGLSWLTILRKRDGFRAAFAGFDPALVAAFTEADIARLLADPGIVRHRGKIDAAIGNARAFLAVQEAEGSFAAFVWRYAPSIERPRPASLAEIPAMTPESDALSKELKRRGFRFVGSTTCYAFMQSAGLVDDHVVGCFRAVDGPA